MKHGTISQELLGDNHTFLSPCVTPPPPCGKSPLHLDKFVFCIYVGSPDGCLSTKSITPNTEHTYTHIRLLCTYSTHVLAATHLSIYINIIRSLHIFCCTHNIILELVHTHTEPCHTHILAHYIVCCSHIILELVHTHSEPCHTHICILDFTILHATSTCIILTPGSLWRTYRFRFLTKSVSLTVFPARSDRPCKDTFCPHNELITGYGEHWP